MISGWTNEPAETEAPEMPLTAALLANGRGEPQPGAVLDRALARSRAQEAREAREAAASAPDPDERAASMIARGVMPGMLSDLSQRLGDTMAELQAEEARIERAERRNERIRRDHAAGRITAMDIMAMDTDEGDPGRVAKLERRAENLKRQIREASALIPGAEDRSPDPLEAASRAARDAGHAAFVEATRTRFAAVQAGLPEPRPFGSAVSRASASRSFADGGVSHAECAECAAAGASWQESVLIHHGEGLSPAPGDWNGPAGVPSDAELAEFGRQVGMPFRSSTVAPGEITRGAVMGVR